MTLEGWCVLAMGALFGLFLFGVWWELRRNLRAISHQSQQRERAIARLESEAAFVREMAREAASQRVAALRAAGAPHLQVLARATSPASGADAARGEEAVNHALGLESVGRILERLAQAAPQIVADVPAFGGDRAPYERPTLNMVRGGKSSVAHDEAAASAGEPCEVTVPLARPRKNAQGRARDGVKSSSIGSGAISASALLASR
jgi:hypothetical protein